MHSDPSPTEADLEVMKDTVEEIHVAEVAPQPNEERPTADVKVEEPLTTEEPKKAKPAFETERKPVKETTKEIAKDVTPAADSKNEELPKPAKKKISFEITNPDDIKIDDKGQGKLF